VSPQVNSFPAMYERLDSSRSSSVTAATEAFCALSIAALSRLSSGVRTSCTTSGRTFAQSVLLYHSVN